MEFVILREWLKRRKLKSFMRQKISWNSTGNAEFPYETFHDGVHLQIRINGFPAYPTVFSLVADKVVINMDGWPKKWIKPTDVKR